MARRARPVAEGLLRHCSGRRARTWRCTTSHTRSQHSAGPASRSEPGMGGQGEPRTDSPVQSYYLSGPALARRDRPSRMRGSTEKSMSAQLGTLIAIPYIGSVAALKVCKVRSQSSALSADCMLSRRAHSGCSEMTSVQSYERRRGWCILRLCHAATLAKHGNASTLQRSLSARRSPSGRTWRACVGDHFFTQGAPP
jgi:hypothetical protein